MAAIHNLTIETRLDPQKSGSLIRYYEEWRTEYGRMLRYVWHRYAALPSRPRQSAFNTHLQRHFEITKRTANSLIFDAVGRYNALLGVKKTEKTLLEARISILKEEIASLKKDVDAGAALASQNELSDRRLDSYRKKKRELHNKRQKLNRMENSLARLKESIASGKIKICFGTKKLFNAQNHLEENHYRSHAEWQRAFRAKRDANIFYLGSKDEKHFNQMFQLFPGKNGQYTIACRKDGKEWKYRRSKKEKLDFGTCRFKYLDEKLTEQLTEGGKGISYRIHFEGKKVYLQAILSFPTDYQPETTMVDGALGLDYNNGFIQLSETDRAGNITGQKRYGLVFHGTGNRAETELRQAISEIARYALRTGKSIVCENLDFKKTKSRQAKARTKKGKAYNRMTHLLDYSRYKKCLKNAAVRTHFDLVMVNPVNTSKIAKQKYCGRRKLNVHTGAAYVIARRGQGFKDRLKQA